MKKQFFFERECIHRDQAEGDLYNGMFFVQAMQRLQTEEAMKMASKVTPFYWVDAPRVHGVAVPRMRFRTAHQRRSPRGSPKCSTIVSAGDPGVPRPSVTCEVRGHHAAPPALLR